MIDAEARPVTRHLLALILCFAAAAWGVPALAAPDEAAFSRDIAERFRAAMPGRAVEVTAPLELRIDTEPEAAEVNLGRLYNFCAHAQAAECEESAERFVAGMSEALGVSPPVRADQLRVAVRHTDFCDYLQRRIAAPDARILTRRLAPQLCVVIMADFPTTMRALNRGDLEPLRLDEAAAWALAERQTLAELPQPDTLEGLADNLVAVSEFDYVPSLLLNTDGWRRAAAARGDLIVAVPSDRLMIVIRRANLADLAAFRAATRENFDAAERGISPLLYRWDGTGWVVVD